MNNAKDFHETVRISLDWWTRYQTAYLASFNTEENNEESFYLGNELEGTWAAFKALVGEKLARETFWAWVRTLPQAYRSTVDPDGN